jgi:5-aminopentanamidase
VTASPSAPLRIGLAQACPTPGDVTANARAAASIVGDAAGRGVRLVIFPELFLTGYELSLLATTPGAWIASTEDPRLDPIRDACESGGVTAILGAALATAEGARHIAAPILGPEGPVGISLKENPCGDEETTLFRAGAALAPFTVDGWGIAIGICFDVSRPAHAERAARSGADLYVASSFYWEGEERRSDLHLGARAMDNRIFSALANYAGRTGERASAGLSGAWAPTGDVIERAGGAETALVVVDLDPAALARYR